eukprot:CAMPEP_0115395016 /NCGR_PEP_ID=MMETSP0271-20121206/12569_1 /TAXON_ID=71861 /ORGANISM="Scrippsiella trochoidea, Strain CCMP3099" /LENGTH=42 /DNA_ID= /DNA_START= /DNA_END= /DNA_ORIENTATION=
MEIAMPPCTNRLPAAIAHAQQWDGNLGCAPQGGPLVQDARLS